MQELKEHQKKTRGKIYDIGFGNAFLDMIPKAQATKKKKQMNSTRKIKNFLWTKVTIEYKKAI